MLQSGLDEKGWAGSMEWYCYLRNVQDLLADGKTPYERRFWERFKGPVIPSGALVEYYPISSRDQCRIYQLGNNVFYLVSYLAMNWSRVNLERRYFGRRHWGVGERWFLECRFEQTFVRFVESLNKRKTSKIIFVFLMETVNNSNDYQTRSCMARSMDENL